MIFTTQKPISLYKYTYTNQTKENKCTYNQKNQELQEPIRLNLFYMNKLRPVLIKMQELLVVLLKTTLQDMSNLELNE